MSTRTDFVLYRPVGTLNTWVRDAREDNAHDRYTTDIREAQLFPDRRTALKAVRRYSNELAVAPSDDV